MGWSDWVHGQQPLVRCECFLLVGPTHLKEAPSPRPRAGTAGPAQRCHTEDSSLHICVPVTGNSHQKLLAPPPQRLSSRPPGSVKSPAPHFLRQLESLDPKNVGELLFPGCQNVLKKRSNLIKNANILFILFKIAKCLKMPKE